MPEFPPELYRMEFVRIYCQLEFEESVELKPGALLRLRRELRRVAGLSGGTENFTDPAWQKLLEPSLPVDPAALRRIQRPGPPLALLAAPLDAGPIDAGDVLTLNWVFWGWGMQYLSAWVELLVSLGRIGIEQGGGRYEVAAVDAEDQSGRRSRLWTVGRDRSLAPPPLCNAGWWLESAFPSGAELNLEFVTPTRLVSGGRPIFRPGFRQLFPFILRRVTSVAWADCGLELFDNPAELLEAAANVDVTVSELAWEDWRVLTGNDREQTIGGFTGRLGLAGAPLGEVGWVVCLASLMNIGKGAAFGSGSFRVLPS